MSKLESPTQKITVNQCCVENPKYRILIKFPDKSKQSFSSRLFCPTHKNLVESLAKMVKIEAKIMEVCD